jgi:uncharacterized protein (DUF1810 family)
MGIVSLEEYMNDTSQSLNLRTLAQGIYLKVNDSLYAKNIKVIDSPDGVDFLKLKRGYYLRFIDRGKAGFHIYGVEVLKKGNVIVHENMRKNQMSAHEDSGFLIQLLKLQLLDRIYFRLANKGQGILLHEDLAVQYAKTESVGNYVNKKFDMSSVSHQETIKKESTISWLQRFIKAQSGSLGLPSFQYAEEEIKNGEKTTHWIWYIFPQLQGLIKKPSSNAQIYSIKDLDEACDYLNDKALRTNYLSMVTEVTKQLIDNKKLIKDLVGTDDVKVISSLTLFSCAADKLIDKHAIKDKDNPIYKLKKMCDALLISLQKECKKTLNILEHPSIIEKKQTEEKIEEKLEEKLEEKQQVLGDSEAHNKVKKLIDIINQLIINIEIGYNIKTEYKRNTSGSNSSKIGVLKQHLQKVQTLSQKEEISEQDVDDQIDKTMQICRMKRHPYIHFWKIPASVDEFARLSKEAGLVPQSDTQNLKT